MNTASILGPRTQTDRGFMVPRPLPAAPLVVRRRYLAVVPGLMPAAVATRCCRRRVLKLACACGS
jgi:hypothetical protein